MLNRAFGRCAKTLRSAQSRDRLREQALLDSGSSFGGLLHEQHALVQIECNVAARVGLLPEIGFPGSERIRPGLDGEDVETDVGERKFAAEPVVLQRQHGSLGHSSVPLPLPLKDGADQVVTVAKNVCFHGTRLAGDALGGITAPVDAGGDRLDENVSVHAGRMARRGWAPLQRYNRISDLHLATDRAAASFRNESLTLWQAIRTYRVIFRSAPTARPECAGSLDTRKRKLPT